MKKCTIQWAMIKPNINILLIQYLSKHLDIPDTVSNVIALQFESRFSVPFVFYIVINILKVIKPHILFICSSFKF